MYELVLCAVVWSGQADFSYLATSGNATNSTLGTSGKLEWQPLPFRAQLEGGFLQSINEHVTTSRRLMGVARAERELPLQFGVYVQGSYFRDPFGSGISNQWVSDVGGQYRAISLSLAYTWEGRLNAPRRDFLGSRIGVQGTRQIHDIVLAGKANYLHDFSHADNWRTQSELGAAAVITKVMALKLSHQWYYANKPDPTKHHADTVILVSLSLRWPSQ